MESDMEEELVRKWNLFLLMYYLIIFLKNMLITIFDDLYAFLWELPQICQMWIFADASCSQRATKAQDPIPIVKLTWSIMHLGNTDFLFFLPDLLFYWM